MEEKKVEIHLKGIDPMKYKLFKAKVTLAGKTIRETIINFIYNFNENE